MLAALACLYYIDSLQHISPYLTLYIPTPLEGQEKYEVNYGGFPVECVIKMLRQMDFVNRATTCFVSSCFIWLPGSDFVALKV